MKGQSLLSTVFAVAVVGIAFCGSAWSVTEFDEEATPEVIFGAGNANGAFTVDRENGIEVGLRAKLRYDVNGSAQNVFNNDPFDNTYRFTATRAPDFVNIAPEWSFEWSVNTDFMDPTSSGSKLDEFQYELGLDIDPSSGTAFTTFDPISSSMTVPEWDHAIGDNSTGNGGGTGATIDGNPADYLNLLANNNVAQNSWNYWFFESVGTLANFNPTIAGTYTIYLEVQDLGGSPLARTEIEVIVELPPLEFDQNVSPEVIFGSGNVNGAFTTDRRNDVQLGLRGKLRFPPSNVFNSNGDGTYSFNNIVGPGQDSDTPEWSFEWSVNTDFNNVASGPNLDSYTYELGMDGDPSTATDFYTFDPITPGLRPEFPEFDHAIGDNSTGNGGGTSADTDDMDPSDYIALLASNNVAQNSWRYDFFNSPALTGNEAIRGFDPTAVGNYHIYLAAFDGDGNEVARTDIQMLIGGAAPGMVADLALTKSASVAGLQHPGDTFDYLLDVTNNDLATATSVVLTDTLPVNASVVSATCSDGTIGVVGATDVVFDLADIVSGDTTTCTLSVVVDSAGNLFNTATVTAANDPNPGDNSDDLLLYGGLIQSVGVTGSTPTPADNDYTRINDAVQNAVSGDRIELEGVFDWNETNAFASWELGSDEIADTDDDYYIVVPDMLSDITFTAASLGSASVFGPGDLPSVDLEGFLLFNGTFNPGWEISNLMLEEFDLTLGLFLGGGVDAFNDTLITNNHIRMPRDVAGDSNGEGFQNIGIHFAFGTNQTISNNVIEIPGDGISTGSFTAASVGMQSNTSGGSVYEGLLIENNEVRVLFGQAANPEFVLGIWENGGAHTSNVVVRNNRFVNLSPDNDPALNNQEGFRVHSHSSATTTSLYEGNYVEGAATGFRWLPGTFGGDLSARDPVMFTSNTAVNNAIGIRLESNGAGNFACNRIVGNTQGLVNDTTAPRVSTANDNWWGCNDGPNNGLCDTSGTSLTTDTWLVASLAADSTSLSPGDMTGLTVDTTFNSDAVEVTDCSLPDTTPVAFSANAGAVSPSDTTLMIGMATSMYTAQLPGGNDTAFADIDSQQLSVDFTIPVITGSAVIVLDTGSSQDFAFDGDLGAFMLDDDAEATLSNTFSMTVPVGSYDVTQMLPEGWVLDSLVCTDPGDNGSSVNGLTATLDVDEGETVTCTYTNFDGRADLAAALAASNMMPLEGETLTITADVVNGGVGDANDTLQELILPTGLTLQSTDCANPVGPAPAAVCDLGTVVGAASATVTYTASVDIGATGPFLVQSNASTRSAETSIANNSAFLSLAVGDNQGTIVIQYVADEPAPEDIGFSGDLGAFALDSDADATLGSVAVFTVATGTYTVTQDAVAAGFLFDSVSCDDSSSDSGTDNGLRQATIALAPQEQVTCVFTSLDDPSDDNPQTDITVALVADPADAVAGTTLTVGFDVTAVEAATNVSLNLNLTTGQTVIGSAGCTEVGAGAIPTCTLGDLAMGEVRSVTVDLQLDEDAIGDFVNMIGTASADEALVDPQTATDAFIAQVAGEVDLSVTIDDGQLFALEGSLLTYEIIVTNGGPSEAQSAGIDVILDDEHDAATASWVCAADPGASCAGSGSGTVSDTPTLASGASVTYTLSVNVIDGVVDGADLEAMAVTTAPVNATDTDSGNDQASDVDTLNSSEPLEEVLFSNGFEGDVVVVKVARGNKSIGLTLPTAMESGITQVFELRFAGRGDFQRVELLATHLGLLMRTVDYSATGVAQQASAWQPVRPGDSIRL